MKGVLYASKIDVAAKILAGGTNYTGFEGIVVYRGGNRRSGKNIGRGYKYTGLEEIVVYRGCNKLESRFSPNLLQNNRL